MSELRRVHKRLSGRRQRRAAGFARVTARRLIDWTPIDAVFLFAEWRLDQPSRDLARDSKHSPVSWACDRLSASSLRPTAYSLQPTRARRRAAEVCAATAAHAPLVRASSARGCECGDNYPHSLCPVPAGRGVLNRPQPPRKPCRTARASCWPEPAAVDLP